MTKSDHGPGQAGREGPNYETRDASSRLVIWTGIGLTIMVVAASAGMLLLFDLLSHREDTGQPQLPEMVRAASAQEPPEPRLQTLPRKDLAEVRAEEARILHTYGWVDRDAGVARIPIERAMEIVAEQGVPARTQPAEPEQKP